MLESPHCTQSNLTRKGVWGASLANGMVPNDEVSGDYVVVTELSHQIHFYENVQSVVKSCLTRYHKEGILLWQLMTCRFSVYN